MKKIVLIGKIVLCILIVVGMALSFATLNAKVTVAGVSSEVSASATGFEMLKYTKSIWGYLVFVFMGLIIAIEFIKKIKKYKTVFDCALATLIVVCLFTSVLLLKTSMPGFEGLDNLMEIKIDVSFGIGFWIAVVAAVGIIVASVIETKVDKGEMPEVNLDIPLPEKLLKIQPKEEQPTQQYNAKKSSGETFDRLEKALSLIEKMADLKDRGIISEEEFTIKKRELLSIPYGE